MTRTINWYTRATYLIIALVMTLGLLLVPTQGPAQANDIDPDLFELEPSLALNVKGAVEKYTITYDGSTKHPAVNITKWAVTWAWMSTPGTIVDGGNPGDPWINVQAAEPGEAHIAAYLDIDFDGTVDKILDAEKKWGEINCTELTSQSLGNNKYTATELVKASFIWGAPGNETRELAADDAVLHWWLMDIAALDDIEKIEADLGDDPCDADGGCGKWTWQENVAPENQANDPFNRISWLQAAHPVDPSTAYLNDNPGQDYATNTSDENGKAKIGVYAASAKTVLLVTLAEYPMKYHGENKECVQHETFKPVIPSAQVKSPQLRWAGEKIVLEKDWGVGESLFIELVNLSDPYEGFNFNYCGYLAVYNLEEGTIGCLEPLNEDKLVLRIDIDENGEPITWKAEIPFDEILGLPAGGFSGCQQAIGMTVHGVSECIFCTEQAGEVDVNAALYPVNIVVEVRFDEREVEFYIEDMDAYAGSPIRNHGFLVYFLEFEEVALAEDITPASGLAGVSSEESVNVAVQVKGFFDYRHSHLMATARPEKLLDLDPPGHPGYGEADVILPAGRYVLPDDWWILAGTRDVSQRPNWDMMDMAHHDNIVSTDELGPYDSGVQTTDPPGVAEHPCIGPFNTLQSWSSDLMWITQATVPGSTRDRNTVVPDGEELNWYDAPMPQALVRFVVTDYDDVVNHSLRWLDKGELEGYGYTGSPKIYHSPFYEVEVPASPFIPAGYDWDSWNVDGPYEFWTDLRIKSFPGDTEPDKINDQDVEVYCDNHGIAGVTVDALKGQGALTITATADYPYAPKRGKYGPRVSPPIDIGSRTDLNPHFVVDKIEVAVGETVTFDPTSTYGGTMVGGTYQRARWDFDNDGVCDEDSYITGKDPLALTTWAYSAEGEYQPCLEITDFSVPVVVRTECMTDPYTIKVGAGLTQIEWTYAATEAESLAISPYPQRGRPELVVAADPEEITVAPMAEELWGIYYQHLDTGDWLYYIPSFTLNTLTDLEPGEYYYVAVSGACTLAIPQA